jgi:hypothetical protein
MWQGRRAELVACIRGIARSIRRVSKARKFGLRLRACGRKPAFGDEVKCRHFHLRGHQTINIFDTPLSHGKIVRTHQIAANTLELQRTLLQPRNSSVTAAPEEELQRITCPHLYTSRPKRLRSSNPATTPKAPVCTTWPISGRRPSASGQ